MDTIYVYPPSSVIGGREGSENFARTISESCRKFLARSNEIGPDGYCGYLPIVEVTSSSFDPTVCSQALDCWQCYCTLHSQSRGETDINQGPKLVVET
jgi:hypothetical protein